MRRTALAFAALVLSVPAAAAAAPAGSTLLVSRPSGLGPVPPAFDNSSKTPGALSPDGRYAVYTSLADGFAAGSSPAVQNVLLRDRQTNTTVLVSRSDGASGAGANSDASGPAIAVAPAGVMATPPTNQPHVLVTFTSQASNLVDHVSGHALGPPGPDEVWMRDVTAGTTTLISRADGMTGAPAAFPSIPDPDVPAAIAVASGGPVVAFSANSSNLPGGSGGLFLRTVNAGQTELVSCKNATCSGSPTGVSASNPSVAVASGALQIAFESSDKTLTGDSAGHTQVMLALAAPPVNAGDPSGKPVAFVGVSENSSNQFGNADSVDPSISADAEGVAFLSQATNLSSDPLPLSNPPEAFLHDFHTASTSLLSRATGAAGEPADQSVSSVVLGGHESRFRAVFDTNATNLGAAGNNNQAYVRAPASHITSLLNRTSGLSGAQGDGRSGNPTISADGSAALFTSDSGNLGDVSGDRFERVHLRTLPIADVRSGTVSLISRPSGTAPFHSGTDDSFLPAAGAVSANGRFVVFTSQSDSLDGGATPGTDEAYVRDLLTNHTILVSRASGVHGAIATDAFPAGISADGRFVAFESSSRNLSPNGVSQVYVRDLVKNTTTLVSRANGANGAPASQDAGAYGISANGKAVLVATASPLDPAGTGGVFHLYLRNLSTNTTALVDRDNGPAGAAAPSGFEFAAVDAAGDRVAFISSAPLAGTPADGVARVFLRNLKAATTTLVSRADGAAGAPSDHDSRDVVIDAAGDVVAFTSYAQNFGATFVNSQVFVRNLATSHTQLVSNIGPGQPQGDLPAFADTPSLDGSGDRVSFSAGGTTLAGNTEEVWVRDLSAPTPVVASRANGVNGAFANGDSRLGSLDPTGNCIAFQSTSTNLGDGFASFDFRAIHLRVLRGQCPLAPPPPPSLSKLKIKLRPKVIVSFVLSRAVTVRLRIFSLKRGHRKGKKCVVKRRHGKKCTIVKARRKLSVSGRAGVNQVRLKGKRLSPGRYRLSATPAGGKSKSISFTVR